MEGKTPETAAAKARMSMRSALKWQNGHCRRRRNRSNGDAALSAYGELYGKVQRKLFAAALDTVLGHAAGHADAPAVAAEELPVGETGGTSYGLHPPGDLGFRQPEHLHRATNPLRPHGVQGPHGGGGDGHHGASRFHVGLGADHGDAAAAIVPALDVALEPVDKLIAGPQNGSCAGVFEVPGAVSSGAGVWE